MLSLEIVNELTLKVNCKGNDVLFVKAGAFIAGESVQKNYRFEKVLLGPQNNLMQAAMGSLMRRATGENLPLMKAILNGDSVTYYADAGRHIIVYRLEQGEQISIESENLLAFTQDCDYNVRLIGVGVLSQKGFATTTLTGRGSSAYVAIVCDGNPLLLNNVETRNIISVDPDAVICWMSRFNCDPQIKMDVNWKTFIGQSSGESYTFEWDGNQQVAVLIQPNERPSGLRVAVD